MDHDKLNRLLQLVEDSSVTEIEYAESDWRVKLIRGQQAGEVSPRRRAEPLASALEADKPRNSPSVEIEPAASRRVITAGMTGTFYRAPAPDQSPFVAIGDIVQEGQTVAVVEAMKLLNSIEADCSGRVAEIFVEDGTPVTPDTALFAIQSLEAADV
ncbi:acetyl-CoA carboxylase biotin carboxyl carrier protein [Paraburkholderia sp. C35]|uniref:acetyl-CoA carboxylase biotin carboxyl carrier protein n=1 Tax=Paraburkholderia sp. C35 TaxID=2126993 RepID=UPI000D68B3B0|nr:acetyl-CoA carboxylase biotin carboxyl carrier protein [Paraburkholderia sp. C35]